jgi:hypothetical protein
MGGFAQATFWGGRAPEWVTRLGLRLLFLETSYSEVLPVLSTCVWKTT